MAIVPRNFYNKALSFVKNIIEHVIGEKFADTMFGGVRQRFAAMSEIDVDQIKKRGEHQQYRDQMLSIIRLMDYWVSERILQEISEIRRQQMEGEISPYSEDRLSMALIRLCLSHRKDDMQLTQWANACRPDLEFLARLSKPQFEAAIEMMTPEPGIRFVREGAYAVRKFFKPKKETGIIKKPVTCAEPKTWFGELYLFLKEGFFNWIANKTKSQNNR